MRATLASVSLLLPFGILSAAISADKITYLEYVEPLRPRRHHAEGVRPRGAAHLVHAGDLRCPTRQLAGRQLDQIDLPQGQGKALRAQRAHPCAHRTLQSRQGATEPALQALTVG